MELIIVDSDLKCPGTGTGPSSSDHGAYEVVHVSAVFVPHLHSEHNNRSMCAQNQMLRSSCSFYN
jgi:hypothetical protein